MTASVWPDGRSRRESLPQPERGRAEKGLDWYTEQGPGHWWLVDNLSASTLLTEATKDPTVTINYRPNVGFRGLSIRHGRSVSRITDTEISWQIPAATAIELLPKLFTVCGVGPRAYPTTLGLETMRALYPPEAAPFPVPLGMVWHDLHHYMVGGRVDTLRPGETFETAWELDMNAAYVAAMQRVPSGFPRRIWGEPKYSPSYSHYTWTAPGDNDLGPLAIRQDNGDIAYPVSGSHEGWYWDFEIERARGQRVVAVATDGYTWDGLTDAFTGWAAHMWDWRQLHPDLADLCKLIAVAGIGALGWSEGPTHIVRLEDDPEARPLHSPRTGYSREYGVRQEAPREGGLLQVASYVRAVVRDRLYTMALPYAARGTLIATDYDAIRISEPPIFESPGGFGGCKLKELHNVRVEHPRWIKSDEKVRTPGVSR